MSKQLLWSGAAGLAVLVGLSVAGLFAIYPSRVPHLEPNEPFDTSGGPRLLHVGIDGPVNPHDNHLSSFAREWQQGLLANEADPTEILPSLPTFRKGEHKPAIDDFRRAIQLAPDDPLPYYNRAQSWMCLHQWTNAESDLDNAQRRSLDVARAFASEYGSVTNFEQRHNVHLPLEVARLFAQQS